MRRLNLLIAIVVGAVCGYFAYEFGRSWLQIGLAYALGGGIAMFVLFAIEFSKSK